MRRAIAVLIATMMLGGTVHAQEIALPIRPLYQAFYTDVLFEYKGESKSVDSSGCAAVCISMVLAYLMPSMKQTPETVFLKAFEMGMYRGNGLSMWDMRDFLRAYGVPCEWRALSAEELPRTLRAGKPIIAFMGEGYFTENGHYIVLYGLTESGHVMVIDPKSPERSSKTYRVAALLEQLMAPESFLVCEIVRP